MYQEQEAIPEISVVMATRNRQDYLDEAIKSVLEQSYDNFEFIIVDDASSDNTPSILKSYQSKDSRIKVLRNDQQKGISYSRNRGFDVSRGKYIAVMDDDDIAVVNRFQIEHDYLEKNKEIAAVASDIEVFQTGSETKDNVPFCRKSWVVPLPYNLVPIMMMLRCIICHSSVMMSKEFLLSKKLRYNENIPCCVDYDLWVNIVLNNGKISILDDVLQKYRVHSQSITTQKTSRMVQDELADKLRIRLLKVFFDSEHDTQMYFRIFKGLSEVEKLKQIKFLNETKGIFSDTDINQCIKNASDILMEKKVRESIQRDKDLFISIQTEAKHCRRENQLRFACDHVWSFCFLKWRFLLCKCLSWGKRRNKYRAKYKAVRDLLRAAAEYRRLVWQSYAREI